MDDTRPPTQFLCGLNIDDVTNPIQVLRMLACSSLSLSSIADPQHSANEERILTSNRQGHQRRQELSSRDLSKLVVNCRSQTFRRSDEDPKVSFLLYLEAPLELPPLVQGKVPLGKQQAAMSAPRRLPGSLGSRCGCTPLNVDQQRARHLKLARSRTFRLKQLENHQYDLRLAVNDVINKGIATPSGAEQLACSRLRLDRNSLAKRLCLPFRGQRGRIPLGIQGANKRPNYEPSYFDLISLSLYKLEQLTREANSSLIREFELIGQQMALQLEEITIMRSSENSPERNSCPELPMIRSPVEPKNFVLHKLRQPSRITSDSSWSSQDSGVELNEPDFSVRLPSISGIRMLPDNLASRRLVTSGLSLERLLEFRGSSQVQSILGYSAEFFKRLLSSSDLFKLFVAADYDNNDGNNRHDNGNIAAGSGPSKPLVESAGGDLMTTHNLRLFACVECQKLRSAIRFKWLPACLLLALEQEVGRSTGGQSAGRPESEPDDADMASLWDWLLVSRRPQPPKEKGSSQTSGEKKKSALPSSSLSQSSSWPFMPANGRCGAMAKTVVANGKPLGHDEGFFELLASLMSLLVRRHFLEPALELLCSGLAGQQLLSSLGSRAPSDEAFRRLARRRPRLSLEVLLTELAVANESSPPVSLIHCSKPDEELKAALYFLVDELVTTCSRLPRAEAQLEGLTSGYVASSQRVVLLPKKLPEVAERLGSLLGGQPEQDDLPERAKKRLALLVDESYVLPRAQPTSGLLGHALRAPRPLGGWTSQPSGAFTVASQSDAGETNIDSQPEAGGWPHWIEPAHLSLVHLVNEFRCGEEPKAAAVRDLEHSPRGQQGQQGRQGRREEKELDERLHRLGQSCRQVALLDGALDKLELELDRFHDFGFAMLDYAPMQQQLAKCIRRERRLVVRLQLDELAKIMESVRLQLEELELSLDLEVAIDDYLADEWHARQSNQADRQQRAMLLGAELDDEDDNDDKVVDELEMGIDRIIERQPEPEPEPESLNDAPGKPADAAATSRSASGSTSSSVEDERFASSLMGSSNEAQQQQQQLASMVAATGSRKAGQPDVKAQLGPTEGQHEAGRGLWAGARRVAPIVECRLLASRYKRFNELISNELAPLQRDINVSLEGLVFLSDFAHQEQLEPRQMELIEEISARWQDFEPMLEEALKRLHESRKRLRDSGAWRSRVLTKLVLEFHLLMGAICSRRLVPDHEQTSTKPDVPIWSGPKDAAKQDFNTSSSNPRPTSGRLSNLSREGSTLTEQPEVGAHKELVRQLDAIQETSDWAQKLSLRFEFLIRQNKLLASEGRWLAKASLEHPFGKHQSETSDEQSNGQESSDGMLSESRLAILTHWRDVCSITADLWRLAEEFETQQLKWLSSDLKRIDFGRVESSHRSYESRLAELAARVERSLAIFKADEQLNTGNEEPCEILEANLAEVGRRLESFRSSRLPIFRFFANQHLDEIHWRRLAELLNIETSPGQSSSLATLTTLQQFLEHGIESHLHALEAMARQATVERQLSNFLLLEAKRSATLGKCWCGEERVPAQLGASIHLSAAFEDWSRAELVAGATRFLQVKLADRKWRSSQPWGVQATECGLLAEQLVSIHQLVERYLTLSYTLNLQPLGAAEKILDGHGSGSKSKVLALRSCRRLVSPVLVRRAMFVELLRLFADQFIELNEDLGEKIDACNDDLEFVDENLGEIIHLSRKVDQLRNEELRTASRDVEQTLVSIERQTVKLELEREILATKEASLLKRQREALAIRDKCIRQISERAIPAIRAAAKALNTLDERALRALRFVSRPQPPEPIRLVIEAVCLLRSCVSGSPDSQKKNQPNVSFSTPTHNQSRIINDQINSNPPATGSRPLEPERRFDALSGKMIENYWPMACRMLNGTHSSRFVADLRRVDKQTLPRGTMRLIRSRYLSSDKFNLQLIKRSSRECALLAQWLIAVDVFDRVLNVVRPNYGSYIEAEQQVSDFLRSVGERRHQIQSIGRELQDMEDSFALKIGHKTKLIEALEACERQLKQVEFTRTELERKRELCLHRRAKLRKRRDRLLRKCLMEASRCVYLEALDGQERRPLTGLVRRLLERPPTRIGPK